MTSLLQQLARSDRENSHAQSRIDKYLPIELYWHVLLARMGKTNDKAPAQLQLLGPRWAPLPFEELKNPVELTIHARKESDASVGPTAEICTSAYNDVRKTLQRIGMQTATWISNYFVPHNDVSVSNIQLLQQQLDSWSVDFCSGASFEEDSIVATADHPPRSRLVDSDGHITGDVHQLLDFAIIGSPKTATTTLMKWLANHDEVQMYQRETNALRRGQVAEMVQLLHALPPANSTNEDTKVSIKTA